MFGSLFSHHFFLSASERFFVLYNIRCPPCQGFSPRLKEFYNATKDQIEIIYISSDRTVPDFEAYFGGMPWLSLPALGTAAIKSALAQQCQIRGIPALLVLQGGTGHYITNTARDQVEAWFTSNNAASKEDKKAAAQAIVKEWLDAPAVPLAQANLGSAGPKGLQAIFSMIARNPAMVFGFIYLVKVRFVCDVGVLGKKGRGKQKSAME